METHKYRNLVYNGLKKISVEEGNHANFIMYLLIYVLIGAFYQNLLLYWDANIMKIYTIPLMNLNSKSTILNFKNCHI